MKSRTLTRLIAVSTAIGLIASTALVSAPTGAPTAAPLAAALRAASRAPTAVQAAIHADVCNDELIDTSTASQSLSWAHLTAYAAIRAQLDTAYAASEGTDSAVEEVTNAFCSAK